MKRVWMRQRRWTNSRRLSLQINMHILHLNCTWHRLKFYRIHFLINNEDQIIRKIGNHLWLFVGKRTQQLKKKLPSKSACAYLYVYLYLFYFWICRLCDRSFTDLKRRHSRDPVVFVQRDEDEEGRDSAILSDLWLHQRRNVHQHFNFHWPVTGVREPPRHRQDRALDHEGKEEKYVYLPFHE